MKPRTDWPRLISALLPGLTLAQAVRRLRRNYHRTRRALLAHGYRYDDGRHYGQTRKVKLEDFDWSLSNIDNVRRLFKTKRQRISRQRVHVLRKQHGKPLKK